MEWSLAGFVQHRRIVSPGTVAGAVGVLLACSPTYADYALQQLRADRLVAANQQRRIIFNNDGDEIYETGIDTRQELLDLRTTALLNSQVDTISYYSTWGMKLHHSNGPFGQLYSAMDPTQSTQNYQTIRNQTGLDTLEIMIQAGHASGKEVWYSNRMNDIHDSFYPSTMYNFRVARPDLLVSNAQAAASYSYPHPASAWTAWDFSQPEVRNMTVAALREVCQTYDVDGIELDSFRWYSSFKETLALQPVTQAHIDMMNGMMRDIRAMTEEEGIKRGRPILIAARAADDAAMSRNVGLDVQTWLNEGLVDVLTQGRFIDFQEPRNSLISLAHSKQVPVYPMLQILNRAPYDDREAWRGEAMAAFGQGADGIASFNMFDPRLAQWRELGDPKILAGMDKAYVWDYLASQRNVSNSPHVLRQAGLSRWNLTLSSTPTEPVRLYVGDDFSSNPADTVLRIHVTNVASGQQLRFSFNGQSQGLVTGLPNQPSDFWIELPINWSQIVKGENLLTGLCFQPVNGVYPTVDTVRLDVKMWGWNTNANGNWNSAAAWRGPLPNGVDARASFLTNMTAPHSIFTDTAVTVGTLKFNNENTYNITGLGSLTLQVSNGSALIDVAQGSHKINLPLVFASNTTVNVADGATLTISDPAVIKAGKTVTRNGNLVIAAPLTIEAGGALVVGSGGALSLSGLPALGNGARIDLTNNSMTVEYNGQSPSVAVLAQLASGYASGQWNGAGLMTSAGGTRTALGWADDASQGSILVKYSYYGDANLDGAVTTADFTALAAHFNSTGKWATGDFNYDGTINALDFNALATNFGMDLSTTSASSLGAVVPEPVAMGWVATALAGTLMRYRGRERLARSR